MRFGIFGPGRIAGTFVRAMAEVSKGEITCVASKSMERAEAFARQNQIPYAFGSYEELAASAECDAVYVATTNNYHYENVKLCIEAGKHVLCEKPMTLSAEDTAELFALAKARGVFLMEAMWSIFLPSTVKARELIASGAIGALKHVDSTFSFYNVFDIQSRLYSKALGGGALYDLGVYNLWVSTFIAGAAPAQTTGVCEVAPTGIDASDCLSAMLENGVTASMKCGFAYNGDGYLTAYGTQGSLRMESMFHDCRKVSLHTKDGVQEFTFDFKEGFRFEIEEVIRCVESGALKSVIATPALSIRMAGIIDQALRNWKIK